MEIVNVCFIIVFLVIVTLVPNFDGLKGGPGHDKPILCYFASYADHRPGRGNFKLENFNPTLCTHLIYAFVLLNQTDDSLYTLAPLADLKVDTNGNNNIAKLKEAHPHLRVTFAIGGWQDGSIKYSNMAADATRRKIFVNNTLNFIEKHHFDGTDIVWEYPAKRGGSRLDKQNFVLLVKELREAFDPHNLIVTAALDSSKDTIDYGYEIPELSKYLHYMLVMTYDFNGKWSRNIGHNAPMYSDDLLNIAYPIKLMLKLGADPNKVILGIPLYGRTFIMVDPIDSNDKLPGLEQKFNKSYTFGGPFTQEEGYIGYNEICLELTNSSSKWKIYWDDFAKTPFAINGNKFITYDDTRSIQEKVSFAMMKKLGGIMVWSVDTDDFRGDCHQDVNGYEDYPLLRTINREIEVISKLYKDNLITVEESKMKTVLENKSTSLEINFLLIFFVNLLTYCICYK